MTLKTKKPTLKAQLARRDDRIDLLEDLLQGWCNWLEMRPLNAKLLIALYRKTRAALRDISPDAS